MDKKRKKVTVIENPNEQEILSSADYSLSKAIWMRFRRHKLAVLGLFIFLFLLLFTLLLPVIEVMTGYPYDYTSQHQRAVPGSIPGVSVQILDPDWYNEEIYPSDFWFTSFDYETGMAEINMETFKDPAYHDLYFYDVKSYGYLNELDRRLKITTDHRGYAVAEETDDEDTPIDEFFIGRVHQKRNNLTGQISEYIPIFDNLQEDMVEKNGKMVPRYTDIGPAGIHVLGTDNSGHDLLPRLSYGGRVSLLVAFTVTLIVALIGIFLGSMAGFFGGFVDAVFLRTIELMGTLPLLPLYIVLTQIYGQSILTIIFIFSVFGWSGVARMTRGQFIAERSQEYTEAARAIGAGNMRITFKHVLPNAVAPTITQLSMSVGGIILSESGLSFLGFGVDPIITPTWGALINEAYSYFTEYPWPALFSGLLIFLIVSSFFFLGDGLRDALDPRQKV
jgi:peptide/nickel transport system permease protein